MLFRLFIFLNLLLLISCASQPNSRLLNFYQSKTQKPYTDVLTELEIAITGHNFRITGHSRVGKVIRERGTKNFPNYDTIQFCNLSYAKTLLLISPHAVSYMPCNIVTYEFGGQTIVKTYLLPTDTDIDELNQLAEKMNQTLKQIVDFAVTE